MTPILWLLVLALIWGGSIPVTKLGLSEVPPLALTALRYLAAAPLFAGVLWKGWPLLRKEWGLLIAAGTVNGLAGQLLQNVGVKYTTANAATLLGATIPLLFVLLTSLKERKPLGLWDWAGLASAMAGVGVLVVGSPQDLSGLWNPDMLLGNGLILLSALSVAVYYLLTNSLTRRLPPTLAAGATTLVAAIALSPFGVWDAVQHPFTFTFTGGWVVLYLGIGVTFIGLQIWLGALQKVPASVAAALLYLQPLAGMAVAALLLGEPITPRGAAGAGLIFLGIGFVYLQRRGPTATPAASSHQ